MKITPGRALILGALAFVLFLLILVVWRGREAAERAKITINDQDLLVRVADSPWERKRGLSGFTAAEVKAQGMLFVFKQLEIQHFWMKGMKLDLDVVWIKDGNIVLVQENIPAPKPGEEPAKMSSNPIAVDMVLELPAGYVQRFDILPGSTVKIELP